MFKKILTLVAVALTAISAFSSRPTVKYDRWTIHPSFDNLPRRIIDTPNKVYFFVHQRPYHKTLYKDADFEQPIYSIPAGAVFTLDKANPSQPMGNINNLVPLSGADMVAFEVDLVSGVMVFAYTDGGVDVVSPDMKVHYFDQLARRNFPGASKVNNISFDPATASVRVTCESGYLEISTRTFSVVRSASWTKPVNDIISATGRTVAIIDGKVCVAPTGADIMRLNAFSEIPDISARFSGTPMRTLPLSDNTFGIVTDYGQIAFLSYAGSSWVFAEKVKADAAIKLDAAVSAANPIEHTVIPNAAGWYVSTPSKAYLVKSATSSSIPEVAVVALPGGSTRWSASYDGLNFWFYRERGKFQSASFSGSGWSDLSSPVRPQAPLTTSECAFVYAPGHGLLMSSERGGGYGTMTPRTDRRQPALLSLFKNGRWENVAPVYNLPDAYNTNNDLRNRINANMLRWPLCDPSSIVVDPDFPSYVHMAAPWGGAASYDFANPSRMPLLKVSPNNVFAPFTTQRFPVQTWQDFTGAYCAGFDADGYLWYCCNEQWNKNEYPSKTYVSLYYITPESRRLALETGDASKMTWNRIPVNQNTSSEFYNVALPLVHARNRGKIFWFTSSDNGATRFLTIYDTAGTPADTSDDSFIHVNKFMLPNGSVEPFNYVNQVLEDPVTGNLYLITMFGAYVIDPCAEPRGEELNLLPAEQLSVRDAGGNPLELFSPFVCTRADFDEYGRLWLATIMGGVVCLDPATGSLLAHYTSENSPLPTNNIRGIGWNPDTKSVFISSQLGLLEFRPDQAPTQAKPALQTPHLSVQSVDAGFSGTVAVRNAPADVNLSVTDPAGRIIASLPPAVKGVTFWNLILDDGTRAAPGLYYIRDCSVGASFPPLPFTVR